MSFPIYRPDHPRAIATASKQHIISITHNIPFLVFTTGNQNSNSASNRIISRAAMSQKVAVKDESVKCRDAQLKSMYERCDTDKDGRLSKVELQKVLEELGVEFPRLRAKSVLWHADENEDGYISLNEFGTLVKYALTLSTIPKA
ncbi:probable calcium-binding protein CML27 [Juglans microcarpa x Juglans regia]|uniref:probable calcium-binding protein CML27 n=1 Tax=Juglans microcarpa x Juglans regia TaxID=2249226 RepID=UPI001B7F4943|nr:probable calcium-binding protein CML27 [Juglans microcarpa x Juglans regia]